LNAEDAGVAEVSPASFAPSALRLLKSFRVAP
jgi:hypothetical protein